MPTNKLWIEHTERAAWDSVEALRERLLKAESRLTALASGVERVPDERAGIGLAERPDRVPLVRLAVGHRADRDG